MEFEFDFENRIKNLSNCDNFTDMEDNFDYLDENIDYGYDEDEEEFWN